MTCDALNTQRKLAQFLITTKHCDYCFAVKENQKELFTQVAGWFKTACGQVMAKSVFIEDDGHGRLEERETYVLPAALMKEFHQDVLDKWEGKVRFSDPNAAMKLLAKLYRAEGL